MKTYSIPEYDITVSIPEIVHGYDTITTGAAVIESNLKDQLVGQTSDDDLTKAVAGAMADAIESLILGHAVAGINITSKAYREGLNSCVAACADHL
jgi:hypothetical protein